jgi:hypothetical protein
LFFRDCTGLLLFLLVLLLHSGVCLLCGGILFGQLCSGILFGQLLLQVHLQEHFVVVIGGLGSVMTTIGIIIIVVVIAVV